MSWRVEIRPQVEADVAKAAAWYNKKQPELGARFVEAVIRVWDELAQNPLLNSRRHPTKNIRWRFPERFPYRVVYYADEARQIVLVIAVLHAARSDHAWRSRVD